MLLALGRSTNIVMFAPSCTSLLQISISSFSQHKSQRCMQWSERLLRLWFQFPGNLKKGWQMLWGLFTRWRRELSELYSRRGWRRPQLARRVWWQMRQPIEDRLSMRNCEIARSSHEPSLLEVKGAKGIEETWRYRVGHANRPRVNSDRDLIKASRKELTALAQTVTKSHKGGYIGIA